MLISDSMHCISIYILYFIHVFFDFFEHYSAKQNRPGVLLLRANAWVFFLLLKATELAFLLASIQRRKDRSKVESEKSCPQGE